jgi:ATP dependent DNA ligase-like protein
MIVVADTSPLNYLVLRGHIEILAKIYAEIVVRKPSSMNFRIATRRQRFARGFRLRRQRLKHLRTPRCPFVNLPEPVAGRWGQGLTAEKMESCVWVRPEVVADIRFLEWTGADHLRHTKFVGLKTIRIRPRLLTKLNVARSLGCGLATVVRSKLQELFTSPGGNAGVARLSDCDDQGAGSIHELGKLSCGA